MKKLLLMFAAVTLLCACEKEDPITEAERIESFWMDGNAQTGNQPKEATITRLYSVVFRHNLVVPTPAYVMELNSKRYFYMFRSQFDMDLKVGDKISFKTSSSNPYEIVSINGYDLSGTIDANSGDNPGGGTYFVASDPIEATVQGIFFMKVKYTLPTPVDMVFIATTDGNLIYIKKEKLNIDLRPGDRIVYCVYRWVPNSIVEIKKLR